MSADPRGLQPRPDRAGSGSAPALAKRSFPPVVDARARVLVLGTLPGEESLRVQQYYAHPRNLFWPILFALFDAVPLADYGAKLAFVRAQRIALWDVCMVGEREASADATIRREIPNGPAARHQPVDRCGRFRRHWRAPPLRLLFRAVPGPDLFGAAINEPGPMPGSISPPNSQNGPLCAKSCHHHRLREGCDPAH
jgi:hypothetical protein